MPQFRTARTLYRRQPQAWRCVRAAAATALAAAALAICLPSAALAQGPSDLERQQVELINELRANRGLPLLAIDARLSTAARWMGTDMPANDYFGHTDAQGRTFEDRLEVFNYPSDTYRGENLAAGYPDAPSTFRQWFESPGHLANMVKPEYRAIGIALVIDPDSTYGHYWVTEFGSRVVDAVPSAKVQARLEKLSAAERKSIKRASRACARVASTKRAQSRAAARSCAWNKRMARNLEVLGL